MDKNLGVLDLNQVLSSLILCDDRLVYFGVEIKGLRVVSKLGQAGTFKINFSKFCLANWSHPGHPLVELTS